MMAEPNKLEETEPLQRSVFTPEQQAEIGEMINNAIRDYSATERKRWLHLRQAMLAFNGLIENNLDLKKSS